MGVAGLLLLAFLLDLIVKIPFGGLNLIVDIFGVLTAGIIGFLAFDALRDLR